MACGLWPSYGKGPKSFRILFLCNEIAQLSGLNLKVDYFLPNIFPIFDFLYFYVFLYFLDFVLDFFD